MEDKDLHSQTNTDITDKKENREIFDIMRNENIDIYNDMYSFRNVLIFAVIFGTFILMCYIFG